MQNRLQIMMDRVNNLKSDISKLLKSPGRHATKIAYLNGVLRTALNRFNTFGARHSVVCVTIMTRTGEKWVTYYTDLTEAEAIDYAHLTFEHGEIKECIATLMPVGTAQIIKLP